MSSALPANTSLKVVWLERRTESSRSSPLKVDLSGDQRVPSRSRSSREISMIRASISTCGVGTSSASITLTTCGKKWALVVRRRELVLVSGTTRTFPTRSLTGRVVRPVDVRICSCCPPSQGKKDSSSTTFSSSKLGVVVLVNWVCACWRLFPCWRSWGAPCRGGEPAWAKRMLMLLDIFTALAYLSGRFKVVSPVGDGTSSWRKMVSTAAKFSGELLVTMIEFV